VEAAIDRINPASKKFLTETPLPQSIEKNSIRLKGYDGPAPKISEESYRKALTVRNERNGTGTLSLTSGHPEIINMEAGDKACWN